MLALARPINLKGGSFIVGNHQAKGIMADMAHVNPDTTPPLEAPPGQSSNLVNPYSLQSWLVATSVICLVILVLSIAARLFVKGYILKKVQLEDCRSLTKNAESC